MEVKFCIYGLIDTFTSIGQFCYYKSILKVLNEIIIEVFPFYAFNSSYLNAVFSPL